MVLKSVKLAIRVPLELRNIVATPEVLWKSSPLTNVPVATMTNCWPTIPSSRSFTLTLIKRGEASQYTMGVRTTKEIMVARTIRLN